MAKKRDTDGKPPDFERRHAVLGAMRNAKMARSAHAYVRGNTMQFYEWLEARGTSSLPEGPALWICGDCHTGNLGPVADTQGRVEIQIRDLDQTVIGNLAHDLIRLGLSLATAARGSDLPGLTTVHMMEALVDGYARAFGRVTKGKEIGDLKRPDSVRVVMKDAVRRSWKHLAVERLEDTTPTIPLGKRFWPLTKDERIEISTLFEKASLSQLATSLRGRKDNGTVSMLDAAYWVKGCSSLGRLRYAVLLDVDGGVVDGDDLCLIDIKGGVKAAAPRYPGVDMPKDNAERVIEGARHLAPFLGERMRADRLQDRSVIIRELLSQDIKLEIDQLTQTEAMDVARYVGIAHARQLDHGARAAWLKELRRARSKTIDAPPWLWNSIVELVGNHETAYLDHYRRYALSVA
jgi:uncharacterized protein (DUF2252 family)